MRGYKPSTPFNVPLMLLIPTYSDSSDDSEYGGATQKYSENGEIIYGSFRSFGGTDTTVNGILTVEDTATIETWFDPRITSDCRIKVVSTGRVYDILGEPENINMQNQYLKFKVAGVHGVA